MLINNKMISVYIQAAKMVTALRAALLQSSIHIINRLYCFFLWLQ